MTARRPAPYPELGAMPGPWADDAACANSLFPDAWFATDSKNADTAYAKSVCALCDVKSDCLQFALEIGPSAAQGIWGQTTEEQRRQIMKKRRAAA